MPTSHYNTMKSNEEKVRDKLNMILKDERKQLLTTEDDEDGSRIQASTLSNVQAFKASGGDKTHYMCYSNDQIRLANHLKAMEQKQKDLFRMRKNHEHIFQS